MILVINVCKEKLHYSEFVKPVEAVLTSGNVDFLTRHYSEVKTSDLSKAEKVIICGTSILDNQFIVDLKKFEWVKNFDKPLLGICAGFQILGALYGGKVKNHLEIGFFHEGFDKPFLGFSDEVEVYHLHQNYIDFSKLSEFEVYSASKISQAVKHKSKPYFGVLFHPEVRQKEMILNFANGRYS
jgi:GMP synthase (glutamine-hydrolysing)